MVIGLAVHRLLFDRRIVKGLTREESREVFRMVGDLLKRDFSKYEFEKYLNDN